MLIEAFMTAVERLMIQTYHHKYCLLSINELYINCILLVLLRNLFALNCEPVTESNVNFDLTGHWTLLYTVQYGNT